MIKIKKTFNERIFDDLYNKIKTNYYAVGDLLPTEMEMQEIYNVSRAPIRQALDKLKTEGFITRKPGIGTVVADNSVSAPWTPMGGFSSHFKNTTEDLTCNTIDVSKALVEPEISEFFGIDNEQPVYKITRVRKENEEPIFLLKHYYVDIEFEKVKQAGDILYMRQFASEVLGISFEYVNEEVKAVQADYQVASLLNVEQGYPLLEITRYSYDSDYRPVEYVNYFVKSDQWPYKIEFSREDHNFEY